MLGSRLFSMTLQNEPPIEMIAPGVWDASQPSSLTLQVSAKLRLKYTWKMQVVKQCSGQLQKLSPRVTHYTCSLP